jgi:hypothetical protein
MGTFELAGVPKDLLQAENRFQAWRYRRGGSGRIPEELWNLASRLARRYGVSRTASVLRLDYYRLKKRTEAARGEPPAPGPAFVELPTAALAGKQCLFELAKRTGVTLRVQLVGYDTADLEALARHFGNAD